MGLRFERYGKRFWGVYEKDELLCATVYKKGALALIRRLEKGEPEGRDELKLRREPRHA